MVKPFTTNDPPRIWDFAGRCAPDTTFQAVMIGRPTAKAIGHLIRFLEITQGFIAEDEEMTAARRAFAPDKGIAEAFNPTGSGEESGNA